MASSNCGTIQLRIKEQGEGYFCLETVNAPLVFDCLNKEVAFELARMILVIDPFNEERVLESARRTIRNLNPTVAEIQFEVIGLDRNGGAV